jgi:hypothetical protein
MSNMPDVQVVDLDRIGRLIERPRLVRVGGSISQPPPMQFASCGTDKTASETELYNSEYGHTGETSLHLSNYWKFAGDLASMPSACPGMDLNSGLA